MSYGRSYLEQALENDASNLELSRRLLSRMNFLDILEEPVVLFDSLFHEYTSVWNPGGESVEMRGMDRKVESNKDLVMRIILLQMARDEYCHAISHLLRGHAMAMYGHLRTFVETAGVAYKSKTDKELGDLFIDPSPKSQKEYRKRTAKKKIFPENDHIVGELGILFDRYSRLFHSNFVSFVMRGDVAITSENGAARFQIKINYHDAMKYGETDYLLYCIMVMDLAEKCLSTFAHAFTLPDGVWYRRLEFYSKRKLAAIHNNKEIIKRIEEIRKNDSGERLEMY